MSTMIYGKTLYNAQTIKKAAKEYLAVLPDDVEVLISQGSSGCAIASAMLTLSERKLEHHQFRKSGETSHASAGAGKWHDGYINPCKVAIVDDFIESGETVFGLIDKCVDMELSISAVIADAAFTYKMTSYKRKKLKSYNFITP